MLRTSWQQVARSFSSSSISCSKRSALRKPNISSLTKHLKPQAGNLNGRERREILRSQLKHKTGDGPYIPVKRRLESVGDDNKKKNISSIQKFDDLPLSSPVKQAIIQALPLDATPSEIQTLAIPILLDEKKQQVLLAAETGSGKTFAYLLPTIEKLKRNEVLRRPNRPRAVILVPTRELIDQVVKSAKSLCHIAKFRALGYDRRRLLDELPIDILVTTPTSLMASIKTSQLALTDTQCLVIDEADSMFDSGWGEDCRWILKRASQSHITIVSATLPRSVQRALDDLFPQLTKITTPSLHKSLPNLKQSFVDLDRFQGNRQLALLEVLKKNIKDKKTLVFCNTRKSAELLHKFLESKGLDTLSIYKDAPTDRSETLSLFAESEKPEHKMLVSTDIASRGIDINRVEHVILFDFPTSAIDYLHRVGRTARAGNSGKATSLIGRKDRMMADRIKRSIRDGAILS